MNQDRNNKGPGWGWLIVVLVLTFAASRAPSLRHIERPGDSERRFVLWIGFIVPWATWIWWSFRRKRLRKPSGETEAGFDDRADLGTGYRLGFWIRCAIWMIIAALTVNGIAGIRSKWKAVREEAARNAVAESEPGYAQRFAIFSDYAAAHEKLLQGSLDDIEKLRQASDAADAAIAARYQVTVAQMRRLANSAVTHWPAADAPQPVPFDTSVLTLDALLILNMPFYWLLSLLLFGRSRGLAELLSDAFSTSDSWLSGPFRARALFVLSAIAVCAQWVLLIWLAS